MSDEEEQEDAPDSGPWESGPFCRHYGTPGECDVPCANPECGHGCNVHGYPECGQPDCDCEQYIFEAP